ncbi:MAG: ABC transporter substrate-binding protein [Oscillospiraceae bacterium]|jgi:peptide/nickel transport system substrate-binding protein|nr:ABC transporter substrate-binding protein [Oscillospiraceae bacterium]
MKKGITMLLAIVLTMALLVPGALGETIVSAKDTLVLGVAIEPISLDPYETAGVEAARVKRQVSEGLFEINDAGEYIPLLATSWEWEDNVTILFHLREGVQFSDGIPFTAQDVYDSIAGSKEGSLMMQYIDMEKTQIVDDYTIRVVMKEPTPILFDKFESQHFPIFHKATYENPENNFMYKPIGTGPYIVEEWKTGDSVTLVRNENYWGEPAYCEKVIFRLIPESAQRTIEMEVGSIDINLDTAFEDMEYFADENLYTIGQYAMPTVNALFFNMDETKNSPVRDLKVRQAMAYAIDSEAISKSVYGVGQAANSNLSPYYAAFYDHDLTTDDVLYRYDLEKAKALMAEAGYADGFDLTILLSENPEEQAVAEIMQYELAQIGINLQIVTRSSTTWFATVTAKEEYDVTMFVLYDSSPIYSWMHFLADSTFASPDYTSYRNEAFMDMMRELSATTDPGRQKELLTAMDALVTADLPVYSLHYATSITTMSNAVQGFEYRGGMTNVNEIYFK